MTLDAIKTELTQAVANQQIYNADLTACKDSFSSLLRKAIDAAQQVYLAKRPAVGQYFAIGGGHQFTRLGMIWVRDLRINGRRSRRLLARAVRGLH